MKIYNRKLRLYEEASQYGGGLLEILYHNRIGRFFLKFVVHPFFSRIYGWYQNSVFSVRKIDAFAEQYGIRMEDYEKREFTSFNDFFTRKIKADRRPVDMASDSFVAPADSKLIIYPIEGNRRQMVTVKGVEYTLEELAGGRLKLTDYTGGYCLVFRLTMDDYHRYSFVDDGVVKMRFSIKGKLHTVSSISKEHKIYRENSRVVNVLKTRNFGEMIWIEVGALLVGKIHNHPIRRFCKGMEKGYFELGGSTILLLVKPGQMKPDEDIMDICNKGIEVKLQMGEKIGTKENGV